MTYTAVAVVETGAAGRYAKQLMSHLGHKATVEPLPSQGESAGKITLSAGTGYVLPGPDSLVLRAMADDPESLLRVQDVLGRHLERFGVRNELSLVWEPTGEEEADWAGAAPPATDPAARADPYDS